jgi:hypothetical protein
MAAAAAAEVAPPSLYDGYDGEAALAARSPLRRQGLGAAA